MKLISIGFGSTVCAERILAVIAPESAPIKRLIQEARERGMLIDASFGRKTKSVLLMDTDHVILASVSPEILSARMEEKPEPEEMDRKLFVVSGPSGVGKNTLLNAVIDRSENVRYSVSATSRPIRPGEVDGKSYYFVTRERFEALIADDALLEYAEYVGNYYGTPLAPIREAIANGIDVVMDVEVVGALKIKKRLPEEAVLVFVTAPSFDIIRKRLVHRGDVAPGLMEERLERARWECSQAENYDYIVINDDLQKASEEICAIMLAEKCKTMERIHLIKEELTCSTPQ